MLRMDCTVTNPKLSIAFDMFDSESLPFARRHWLQALSYNGCSYMLSVRKYSICSIAGVRVWAKHLSFVPFILHQSVLQ